MQKDINESISKVAETIGGKKASVIVDLVIALVDPIKRLIKAITNKKEIHEERKKILVAQTDDPSCQYIPVILKNFVGRRFREYVHGEGKSIKHIKKEIEQIKMSRTVIITGFAGIGKSTVLKWLFVNIDSKKGKFEDTVYISSRMVPSSCKSLEDLANYSKSKLLGRNHCLVFFDGLDELPFLKGQQAEFKHLLKLFDENSNSTTEKHKFVITTRPEQFYFQKNLKKKEAGAVRNTVIYEVLPLNTKESLKICKLIKLLKKFEAEKSFATRSFKEKYPSEDNEEMPLGEHEYIHLLKKYITNIDSVKSLLAYPLLCRYAYIIICDRYLSQDTIDKSEVITQATGVTGIEKVLIACIKWEFHDNNKTSASSTEGMKAFEIYKRQTFEFLANIANIMDDKHSIDRDKWSEIKISSKLRLNAALCMLQEDNSGNLTFVHSSFYEYFLARYFVEGVSMLTTEHEISRLHNLVEHNSSFLLIYTELLVTIASDYTKEVCKALKDISKGSIDEVAQYICGKNALIYDSNYCFTIEQYFNVIPMGIVEYAGCTFDRDDLKKILTNGILELNDTKYLTTCNVNAFSENDHITAVVLKPKFNDEIKVVTSSFECIFDKDVRYIGGYWSAAPFSEDDLHYFFDKTEIGQALKNMPIEKMIKDENIIRNIMVYKEIRDSISQDQDNKKIKYWMDQIITFLGRNKKYWCIYYNYTLSVYEMIKKNEQHIYALFRQGLEEKKLDYLALWGKYLTYALDEKTLADSLAFKSSNAIRIVFNSEDFVFSDDSRCIQNYYSAHWKNHNLLNDTQRRTGNSLTETISNVLLCREITDLYEETEKHLSEKPNEKIKLIISDEQLITYFLIGIGDDMVRIAKETLELCNQYNHTEGRIFREFLINNGIEYGESKRNKIRDYLEKNIWL